MNVGFTGHRDKVVLDSELDMIARDYPGAVWVHGGAKGFDMFVHRYAIKHGILVKVVRPDYQHANVKKAPLDRNKLIVDQCCVIVTNYDGRDHGGTKFTVDYAEKEGKDIVYLNPVDIAEYNYGDNS